MVFDPRNGFQLDDNEIPFHTSSDRKLKLIGAPIITVTGKAYWDVGHAPKDQSNGEATFPATQRGRFIR